MMQIMAWNVRSLNTSAGQREVVKSAGESETLYLYSCAD